MKLIILGCAVTVDVKENESEYICIGFNLTTDTPGGERYGATRNIPMLDADLYNKPYEDICYKVLVDMGKMMARLRKLFPETADNEDDIIEEMRDIAIEGLTAFFSNGEWWSKKMFDVHDIKAGNMITDVSESKGYILERDVRIITKA